MKLPAWIQKIDRIISGIDEQVVGPKLVIPDRTKDPEYIEARNQEAKARRREYRRNLAERKRIEKEESERIRMNCEMDNAEYVMLKSLNPQFNLKFDEYIHYRNLYKQKLAKEEENRKWLETYERGQREIKEKERLQKLQKSILNNPAIMLPLAQILINKTLNK